MREGAVAVAADPQRRPTFEGMIPRILSKSSA